MYKQGYINKFFVILFLLFINIFIDASEIQHILKNNITIFENCVRDTGSDCIKDGYSYQINEKDNPLKAWTAFSACTGCFNCYKWIYLGPGNGNVKNIMKMCKNEACNSGSIINIGEKVAIKTWCDNGCNNKKYLDRKSSGESSANTWSGSQWNKIWATGQISVYGSSGTDSIWVDNNILYFKGSNGIHWEFRKLGIQSC